MPADGPQSVHPCRGYLLARAPGSTGTAHLEVEEGGESRDRILCPPGTPPGGRSEVFALALGQKKSHRDFLGCWRCSYHSGQEVPMRTCPDCKLLSLDAQRICDCGFDFDTGRPGVPPHGSRFCEDCCLTTTGQSTGDLGRINGFGRTLFREKGRCRSCGSVECRIWYTFFFIPLIPGLRYRVIFLGGGRFLARRIR